MDIDVMANIQAEKEKEISTTTPIALNSEGTALAAEKRFTLDVIDTPVDPLR